MARMLYQFPLSHYSEKARWLLDSKALDYQVRSLIPGPHRWTSLRLAGIRTLPILRDGPHIIGDSTAIALHLDKHYPQHPLIPDDPAIREQVLALEALADELGVHVRRCVWSLVIHEDQINRLFFNFGSYGDLVQRLSGLFRPILRQMIRHRFGVWPKVTEDSWKKIQGMMDLLAAQLEHNSQNYLVGSQFTLADLTMAAMLAPLIGPSSSVWSDDAVQASEDSARDIFRNHITGQWVENMYRKHRGPIFPP